MGSFRRGAGLTWWLVVGLAGKATAAPALRDWWLVVGRLLGSSGGTTEARELPLGGTTEARELRTSVLRLLLGADLLRV